VAPDPTFVADLTRSFLLQQLDNHGPPDLQTQEVCRRRCFLVSTLDLQVSVRLSPSHLTDKLYLLSSAELSEFFERELSSEGYSGCEVRVTHARTEIIIRATHTQEVLGEKGRRIRELTSLIQKRFRFTDGSVELYAEKVGSRQSSWVFWRGKRR
jgi:hypothetical protein